MVFGYFTLSYRPPLHSRILINKLNRLKTSSEDLYKRICHLSLQIKEKAGLLGIEYSLMEKKKHSLILRAAYSSEERKRMQREKSPLVNNKGAYEEKKQAAIRSYWLAEEAMSEEAKRKRSEARRIGWETRRKNAHN